MDYLIATKEAKVKKAEPAAIPNPLPVPLLLTERPVENTQRPTLSEIPIPRPSLPFSEYARRQAKRQAEYLEHMRKSSRMDADDIGSTERSDKEMEDVCKEESDRQIECESNIDDGKVQNVSEVNNVNTAYMYDELSGKVTEVDNAEVEAIRDLDTNQKSYEPVEIL